MNAIATRSADAAGAFVPPPGLAGKALRQAKRLRWLVRAAIEGLNAATPDVAPEFYRFPFP